ncbi:MAG TPA: outer membrane beta-barrel protein [Flavobacteriales bacterium]|nr:outer membrane beta-barrel protein [Flavobacteriales bacterium]HMR26571.1 outer membrane beta-barrel protein [Flavobacteriales bacterium]
MRPTFLLSILSLSALTSSAQKMVELRGYGGINLIELTHGGASTVVIDGQTHDRNVKGNVGYQAGLGVSIGHRFYVQPGVYWQTISAKTINTNQTTGVKLEDEPSVSVISVPVRVGLRLLPTMAERIVDVRIFGGITGNHVLSVKDGSDKIDLDKDDFKNLFMGADVGLGVDVLFLFLDAGYEFGLSPIFSDPADPTRYNMFFARLGVRIGL